MEDERARQEHAPRGPRERADESTEIRRKGLEIELSGRLEGALALHLRADFFFELREVRVPVRVPVDVRFVEAALVSFSLERPSKEGKPRN